MVPEQKRVMDGQWLSLPYESFEISMRFPFRYHNFTYKGGAHALLRYINKLSGASSKRCSFRCYCTMSSRGALTWILLVCLPGLAAGQDYAFTIARIKYDGGGDWYSDEQSLPELLAFTRKNTLLDVAPKPDVVELKNVKLYSYPYLYLTGHGAVVFSPAEVRRLRRYLEGGGFLHIDDNYGLGGHIRREMKKVFPEQDFIELPFDHPIYHTHYSFPDGLPKIHEHDGKPTQGFGLFDSDGRLCVFFSYESDLGDGWEPEAVHDNPPKVRERALQMGVNILVYAMMMPEARIQ